MSRSLPRAFGALLVAGAVAAIAGPLAAQTDPYAIIGMPGTIMMRKHKGPKSPRSTPRPVRGGPGTRDNPWTIIYTNQQVAGPNGPTALVVPVHDANGKLALYRCDGNVLLEGVRASPVPSPFPSVSFSCASSTWTPPPGAMKRAAH